MISQASASGWWGFYVDNMILYENGKHATQLAGNGEERIALLDLMAGYNVAISK